MTHIIRFGSISDLLIGGLKLACFPNWSSTKGQIRVVQHIPGLMHAHIPSQCCCPHMRGCVSSSVPQMASSAAPGLAWSNHTHQPAPELKKYTSSVTIEPH